MKKILAPVIAATALSGCSDPKPTKNEKMKWIRLTVLVAGLALGACAAERFFTPSWFFEDGSRADGKVQVAFHHLRGTAQHTQESDAELDYIGGSQCIGWGYDSAKRMTREKVCTKKRQVDTNAVLRAIGYNLPPSYEEVCDNWLSRVTFTCQAGEKITNLPGTGGGQENND